MAMGDDLEHAVKVLIEAALDPTRAGEAGCHIAEITGSKGSVVALTQGSSSATLQLFFADVCVGGQQRDDLLHKFMRDYVAHDERLPRLTRMRHGHLLSTGDLYTDCEKQTSLVYNEILNEFEAQDGLNVRLDGLVESHVCWGLCDSRDKGGWSSEQVRIIKAMRPHVRAYAVMRQTLKDAGALATSVSELLDNLQLGVVQLDSAGKIARANDRALELFREGDAVLDRSGVLAARLPAENVQLARLMRRAAPPFGRQGAAGTMLVSRSASRVKLSLQFIPIGCHQTDERTRSVAVLVLIADPATPSQVDPPLLELALGLTPAQSRLASALAAGQTVRDIAESTGRSQATLNSHLRRMYRRLGIRRQKDLVRHVAALRGMRPPDR